MSLVNDMLRDLDRRGAGHPGTLETGSQNPPGNDSRRPRVQPAVWLWLLVGVLVGAGGLGLLGFWSAPASEQEPSVPGGVAPESDANVPPVATEVDRTAPRAPGKTELEILGDALAPNQRANPPEPDPGTASDRDETLSRLLQQAEEARSRDRLTQPAGDNAYDYYQQVLVMEPGHAAARSGLAAIARRYTEMAETALDAGDLDRARRLILRGLSVEPGHSGLQQSRQRLEGLASTPQSDTDHETAIDPNANRPPEASPPADDRAATGGEPQMHMNLDAQTRDRRAAQRGRELLAGGKWVAAREHLQSSLRAWAEPNSPPVHTTEALLDLYLAHRDYASAETLLQASEALPELALHRFWAELEQARGRPEAAIGWLESALASARQDEHYRSLLARLYYTQGHQDRAAESYSRLLADFGGRPAYWLGLGLARDAQDREPGALEAFLRAQTSGAYERNPEITEYLKRRIAALQRQTQASEP